MEGNVQVKKRSVPTLQKRTISGKGLLKVDQNAKDYKDAKIITLFASVLRKPTNEYINKKYNPSKSWYATILALRGDYVLGEHVLRWEKQAWDYQPQDFWQATYAVQCAYAGTLQSIANLGAALGATPTSIVDGIKLWVHQDLFPDEYRIICYADTAIDVSLVSRGFDKCTAQKDFSPDQAPPPPPGKAQVPPGTPIKYSPPYDNNTDNGNTVPNLNDTPGSKYDLPQGSNCVKYQVNVLADTVTSTGAPSQFNLAFNQLVFGPVEDLRTTIIGNVSYIQAYGKGLATGSLSCSTPQWVRITDSGSFSTTVQRYINLRLVSVVAV